MAGEGNGDGATGSTSGNGSARGGLGTIRNAVRLLDLLAEGPPLHHLTDLAARSGMSVPTVHRLLRSLVQADYAVQDPATSRYGLGPQLTRLSKHYLARSAILAALAPFVVALRNQLAATISVYVLAGREVMCIDQVDGDDRGPFRRSPRALPALDTAAGRVLAAHAAPEVWAEVLSAAAPETVELAQAHRDEWAAANHIHLPAVVADHVDEVAVPLRDAEGTVVAALAADVPTGADEAHVRTAAAALERTAVSCGRSIGNG